MVVSPSTRRRTVLTGCTVAAGCSVAALVAYRLYQNGSIGEGRALVRRWRAALFHYSEALLTSAEICSTVAQDLQSYLGSNDAELPQSLRQLARLLQSPAMQDAITSVTSAACRGVAETGASFLSPLPGQSSAGLLEAALDTLCSERGQTLLMLAIRVACSASTTALVEALRRAAPTEGGAAPPSEVLLDKILHFAGSPRGSKIICACAAAGSREATSVYMSGLAGSNGWEDLFSVASKPQYADVLDRCCRASVQESVRTFLGAASGAAGEESRGGLRGKAEEAAVSSRPHSVAVEEVRTALEGGVSTSANGRRPLAADQVSRMGGSLGPLLLGNGWAGEVIKVAKVPEARTLFAALAASAAAGGVHATLEAIQGLLGGTSEGDLSSFQGDLLHLDHKTRVATFLALGAVLFAVLRLCLVPTDYSLLLSGV